MRLFRWSKMTLSDLADEFILEKRVKKSAKTAINYRWRLTFFLNEFGGRQPHEVSKADLQRFVINLREHTNLADASVNAVIQSIKALFNYAKKEGYITKEVHHAISQQKPRDTRKDRPTNAQTVNLMLKNLFEFRDKVILNFAADTAARRGEIATLLIQNVNFDELKALVTGKTGTRWVTFTQPMADMLRDYIDNHRPHEADHGYVFTSIYRPYQPLHPDSITSMTVRIRNRLREAGLPHGKTNPHAFRHWVCQQYARNGDINLAQMKLGHADIATTMYYVNNDVQFLQSRDGDLSVLRDLE